MSLQNFAVAILVGLAVLSMRSSVLRAYGASNFSGKSAVFADRVKEIAVVDANAAAPINLKDQKCKVETSVSKSPRLLLGLKQLPS